MMLPTIGERIAPPNAGTAQRQRHGETALQVKPVRDNNRDEQARTGGDNGARKRASK